MNNPRFVLLLCLPWMLAACARSPAYQREQGNYARPQTPQERNKVLAKAEKFNAPKKRGVVLPFWNDTPIKGQFEIKSRNALKDILLDQNRMNLVDDRDVSLRSQDFYLDAQKINLSHLVENGRKWGVSLIIMGRISKIVFRRKEDDVGLLRPSSSVAAATVELRLIDVAGGKEVAIGQGVGTGESSTLNLFGADRDSNDENRDELVEMALSDAIQKAMPTLNREMERIQWRGKIARIAGNRVYVNAGRATGVNIGDILKVMANGQDIFDPDTGLYLGHSEGDLKGTLEVVDYFGEDGSIASVHSGGNITEGDLVQLY